MKYNPSKLKAKQRYRMKKKELTKEELKRIDGKYCFCYEPKVNYFKEEKEEIRSFIKKYIRGTIANKMLFTKELTATDVNAILYDILKQHNRSRIMVIKEVG